MGLLVLLLLRPHAHRDRVEMLCSWLGLATCMHGQSTTTHWTEHEQAGEKPAGCHAGGRATGDVGPTSEKASTRSLGLRKPLCATGNVQVMHS